MINKAKEVRTICCVNEQLYRKYNSKFSFSLFISDNKGSWEILGYYYFYCRFPFVNDLYKLLKFQDSRK